MRARWPADCGRRSGARRAAAGAWAAGCLALGLPAETYAAAIFPPALDARSLSAWLRAETDLRPEQVVAVSRASIAAIVAGPEDRAGVKRVAVRSEAIDPAAQAMDGVLSTQLDVYVDCAGRKVRQGAATGHEQRNAAGLGHIVARQESEWSAPAPGTQLESVWRAVCDAAFIPPLTSAAASAPPQAQPQPQPPPLAPTSRPAPARSLSVQVGAFPNAVQAAAARERLNRELRARLPTARTVVLTAEVHGATYYRLLVTGFASAAEQRDYCASLRGLGRDCIIRGAGPAGGGSAGAAPQSGLASAGPHR